jgi:hypothetical protein
MERGAGATRFKATTDQEWIDAHRRDLEQGAPWVRECQKNDRTLVEVDIAALPNLRLPKDRQSENVASAYVTLSNLERALNQNKALEPDQILQIADKVHEEWLRRNQWVFDKKHDAGGPEASHEIQLMRLPFEELYERGKSDPVAAAEAYKDIQTVLAGIEVLNQVFRGQLDTQALGNAVGGPIGIKLK